MAMGTTEKQLKYMDNQKTILFVTPRMSGFALNDLTILSEEYNIIQNTYNWNKKKYTPFYLIHQFFFVAINISRINKIVIEFGGYWSFIPSLFGKLFGKHTIIICHGTDCSYLPSLNYGSLGKKYIKLFCKLSYQLVDLICPVSESLIKVENDFHIKGKETKQGILNFFPSLKTSFQVIHNALEIDFWQNKGYKKRKNTFMAVLSEKQYHLKGADLIYDMAKQFKDCHFEIVGLEQPKFLKNAPKNMSFSGKLNQKELIKKYCQSEFYFQLSSFEGFGLSLCEAMLCKCIPIGSSVNMIPEIIGENGYILEEKNSHQLEQIIKEALELKNKEVVAEKARQSIINRFSLEKRKMNLLKAIK